jgi:nitrogen regulatory protein P-II 1
MAAILSKQDSARKIDPSRAPESDDRGRHVDGHGGRVCLQDSAGVCDSLAGTVGVVRSGGTRPCTLGMTVSEAKGHGHQKGHHAIYRGIEYEVALLPKIMIEMVADDNRVADIVKVVIATARTGEIGDGRIFILPVEESYHIRSGFLELD